MPEERGSDFIVPDISTEQFPHQWGAERTIIVNAPEGYAAATITLYGPKGGTRDTFRASPEWLRDTGQAMLLAAARMRED